MRSISMAALPGWARRAARLRSVQLARGVRRLSQDPLLVQTYDLSILHQVLAVHEHRHHVRSARSVDQVGYGVVPGLQVWRVLADGDDVRPLAHLERADQ